MLWRQLSWEGDAQGGSWGLAPPSWPPAKHRPTKMSMQNRGNRHWKKTTLTRRKMTWYHNMFHVVSFPSFSSFWYLVESDSNMLSNAEVRSRSFSAPKPVLVWVGANAFRNRDAGWMDTSWLWITQTSTSYRYPVYLCDFGQDTYCL